MHRPTLDLSDADFLDVSKSCFLDMRRIYQTSGEIFLYACNGHGAWEAALANVFSPGDVVLVPETGNFSIALVGYGQGPWPRCRDAAGRLAPGDLSGSGRGAPEAGQGRP